MSISSTERKLRLSAAQSALGSVRLAGGEPSLHLQALLVAWAEGTETLNTIRDLLLEQWRPKND